MKINGLCPMGCGRTLHADDNGHIICGFLECPNPDRVDYEMNRPLHLRLDLNKVHETVLTQAARIAELEGEHA